MKITQIRNATLIVEYAGLKLLVDPMLADQGAYPPFANSLRQDQRNPLVPLPVAIETILAVDAVIVTHLHQDHFDDAAKQLLPKHLPLFAQNDEDAVHIRSAGFHNVEIIGTDTEFAGIQLSKTEGQHGRGEILQRLGHVCGVVLRHPSENTLYIAGDTVWYEGVQDALERYKPEVIVVNGGDNQFLQGGSLVMGLADIAQVHQAAPLATIISSHMEAVNHWTLSRDELKRYAAANGLSSRILVPEDGESYKL